MFRGTILGVACLALAACGRSTRDSEVGPQGGTAGTDGGPGDAGAGVGGTGGAPIPANCERDLESLDSTCSRHADCAAVVRYECVTAGTSRAVGIRRNEVARFHEIMNACGLPDDTRDCPIGEVGPGIGPAPVVTERDDLVDDIHRAYVSASCVEGRCEPLRTRCGAELCGNGTIDLCKLVDTDAGIVFEPTTEIDPEMGDAEPCDGENLGGNTCEKEGYGSGTLACAAESCLIKKSCLTCMPTNDRLVACSGPLSGRVASLALASNGDDVAVAWMTESILSFSRLGSGLEVVAETDVEIATSSAWRISLAHYPGGWVAALSTDANVVDLHAFDEEGAYRGIAHSVVGASSPWLTPQPSGGPLLTYWAASLLERRALLLSPDLTPATASFVLGRSGVNSHLHGVFVGDAFLVALPYSGQEDELGMRIVRVEPDGSVASPPPASFGNYVNEARLAMTDAGPLLVFAEGATEEERNAGTYSVFLDENGSLASTPVLVVPGIEPGALASFSAGALLAASARDANPDVYNPFYADLVRLDAAGSLAYRLPVARHPFDVQSFQVVARTDDAVVAWMSPDGPELARIVP